MLGSNHCRTCFALIDQSLDKAKKLIDRIRNVNATVIEMLTICTGLQVDLAENYVVCAVCKQNLVSFYKFRQKAWDADAKFKEFENKVTVVSVKAEQVPDVSVELDTDWQDNETEWLKEEEEIDATQEEYLIEDQQFDNTEVLSELKQAKTEKKRTLDNDPNPITNRRRRAREPTRQENLKRFKRNEEGFYECPHDTCPGIFKNIGHLEMHLENKHPKTEETSFQCEQCEETFCVYLHLKRHIMAKHIPRPYECSHCGNCYAFREGLRNHMRSHLSNQSREKAEVACNICNKIFCSQGNMLRHRKEVHFPKELLVKPFICNICGSRWPNKARWQAHTQRHTKTNEFVCDICNKAFNVKGSLTLHMQTVHIAERKYFCDQCGKTYKTKYNLRDHQITHSENKMHKCSMCEASFKLSSTLRVHERNVHGGEGPIACDLCGKLCKNAGSMKNHRALHKGEDIPCPYCDKKYKIRNVMERHVQRVHQGIKKRHECSICLKNLWSRKHIAEHIEEVHRDVLDSTGKKADELVRKYWTSDPSGANNGELPPKGIRGRPVLSENF